MNSRTLQRHAAVTVGVLLLLLALDLAELDLPLARLFGGPEGFPYREHWLLAVVMHEGARLAAWAVVLWLSIGVWWPTGPLRRIPTRARLQLAVTPLAAALVVGVLKSASASSCPWDMAEFGRVAHHLPHWPWSSAADGGSGRCFPAGHAAAGFGFLGGWFAWRRHDGRQAMLWLAAALAGGFALGIAQQVRGAHFLSHTLYSAWVCWCVAFAIDLLLHRAPPRTLAIDTDGA